MDLPDSDRGDFSCQRAVDSSSLDTEIYLNDICVKIKKKSVKEMQLPMSSATWQQFLKL